MGQVVEGFEKEAPPKLQTDKGMGSNVRSVDEVLDKLVRTSPRAQVELAGVPVSVVLDTGAETSLISAAFYRSKLAAHVTGVEPVGTYLRVFGVGPCEVPVEGYVQIPLRVFNQTVEAHFLVVKRAPRLVWGVGVAPFFCRVLHQLRNMVVDPSPRCRSMECDITVV